MKNEYKKKKTSFKGIKKVYHCAFCDQPIVTDDRSGIGIKIVTQFVKVGKRYMKITTVICNYCKDEYGASTI